MTERELQEFLDREIKPGLEKFLSGQSEFCLIYERFKTLATAVYQHYGKSVNIEFMNRTHGGGTELMGSWIDENGQPRIAGYLPSIITRIFRHLRQKYPADFRRLFRAEIIAGIMHEADHLFVAMGLPRIFTPAECIRRECVAWAETCEKTIRPMLEEYNHPPCNNKAYYDAWVACGRNADSQQWKDFISRMYLHSY